MSLPAGRGASSGRRLARRRLGATWEWSPDIHPAQVLNLQPQLEAEVVDSIAGNVSIYVECPDVGVALVPPAPGTPTAPLVPHLHCLVRGLPPSPLPLAQP